MINATVQDSRTDYLAGIIDAVNAASADYGLAGTERILYMLHRGRLISETEYKTLLEGFRVQAS